jgi:hypothetical protein
VPTPDTAPDAGVADGKIYVTVIEDPANRVDFPWMADVINNRAMREAFEKAGYTFRVLSLKDPEFVRAKLAPYLDAAGGAPALVVQNGKGKVFSPQKLPQTPTAVREAVEAAVKKAREFKE